MNLSTIVALLTMVATLLGKSAGTPAQGQAIAMANQVIAVAEQWVSENPTNTTSVPPGSSSQPIINQPNPSSPLPQQTPPPTSGTPPPVIVPPPPVASTTPATTTTPVIPPAVETTTIAAVAPSIGTIGVAQKPNATSCGALPSNLLGACRQIGVTMVNGQLFTADSIYGGYPYPTGTVLLAGGQIIGTFTLTAQTDNMELDCVKYSSSKTSPSANGIETAIYVSGDLWPGGCAPADIKAKSTGDADVIDIPAGSSVEVDITGSFENPQSVLGLTAQVVGFTAKDLTTGSAVTQ